MTSILNDIKFIFIAIELSFQRNRHQTENEKTTKKKAKIYWKLSRKKKRSHTNGTHNNALPPHRKLYCRSNISVRFVKFDFQICELIDAIDVEPDIWQYTSSRPVD